MVSKTIWLFTKLISWRSMSIIIQVVSALLISSVAFATIMLVGYFWGLNEGVGGYRLLALALSGLLLVPLISLGASSAKLSVHSQTERLAILRLIGLPESRVRLLAIMETGLVQGVGVSLAFCVSFFTPYLLGLLTISGSRIGSEELQLPLLIRLLIYVSLLLISLISSQMGLRKLILSPLGVKKKSQETRPSLMRLLVLIFLTASGFVLLRLASPSWGVMGIMFAVVLVLVLVMGAINFVGPYLIDRLAQGRVRAAVAAPNLIAARRNLADPKGAWRLVSSIAFTSFILVPAGAMLGFLDAVQRGPSQLDSNLVQLLVDTRMVLLLVVILSFLLVACQTAFAQLIELFEHKDLYIALGRIGTPKHIINKSRKLQVSKPARLASIGAAFVAFILCFPLVSVATTVSPSFIFLVLLLIALGNYLIVWAVRLTNPVLAYLLSRDTLQDYPN